MYPFTAIVGQERLKLALLLNAVHPGIGGVLIRGERGSAKSTAVRALANLLPEIDAVYGCAYNDDPAELDVCDACADRRMVGPLLERVRRQVRIVDLPVGASIERVIGGIDLDGSAVHGQPHFSPGLLARANRGILYMDEVNLLDGDVTGALLDAAAMGWNHVERDGVTLSHPARFLLIGTMNPEEGELRPQLLDRFPLVVAVDHLSDPLLRAEVIRRRLAFEADPDTFSMEWSQREHELRQDVARGRAVVSSVSIDESVMDAIARICATFDADGLRGDIAMCRAAVAHAAFQQRGAVTFEDVSIIAHLALPHRARSHVLDGDEGTNRRIQATLAEVLVG